MGGNCQGAVIAQAVAGHLQSLGRAVELLVLMECSEFRQYSGRVALLFGRDSELNPCRGGADPGARFRESYPAGHTVDLIDGAHGHFFEDANIRSLGRAVGRLLRPG
jgi:hypothetical protein